MTEHQENLNAKNECLPLKTLDDVLSWKPGDVYHSTAPLQKRVRKDNSPKTLVCHDMKGGYLEDRFVNGVQKDDSFSFIHWIHVDMFVYFSHWLVTIPPCSWINAAHRNGVLILGTFITEWDDGALACEKLLSSKQSVCDVVSQLVKIAVFHGFDGWLINIENKIKPHEVKHLEEFVASLTSKMHKANPSSHVIWYDSVIESGELKWQNALNENNRNFFDVSDGIFLNYNWKTEDLKKSVLLAGSRFRDVYVGVDCFGRGCLGGGGYCSNIAVEAARREGLSVAIFAPGWVYECLESENFLENQHKFWGLLMDHLPEHRVKTLPFYTSFCPGFGRKMFRQGKAVCEQAWYNMGLQDIQPDYFQDIPHGGSTELCVEDAFSGGGCLKLSAPLKGDKIGLSFGILSTCFELKGTTVIAYVFKPVSSPSLSVDLLLKMSYFDDIYTLHLTDYCENNSQVVSNNTKTKGPASSEEIEQLDYDPISVVGGEWRKRVYVLDSHEFGHHVVEGINAILCDSTTAGEVSAYIGHLEVVPARTQPRFVCSAYDQKAEKNGIVISCVLEWTDTDSACYWDLYYEVRGQEVYLCTTSQLFYDVCLKLENVGKKVRELSFHLYAYEGHGKQTSRKQSLNVDLFK